MSNKVQNQHSRTMLHGITKILHTQTDESPKSNAFEWQVVELEFSSGTEIEHPYLSVPLSADGHVLTVRFELTSGDELGRSITVRGFWTGGRGWKVRFAPLASGRWSYVAESADSDMNGIRGEIAAEPRTEAAKANNPTFRGFVTTAADAAKASSRNAPHRFFYADGTPFLWIGDTWWNWCKRDVPIERFKRLVADRAAKGFTVGQLFVPGNGWNEASRAHNADYTDINIEHLARVDELVAIANSAGITLWIHGFWGGEGIKAEVGGDAIRRWWKYLVHRYAAFNVIWVLAGEFNLYGYGGFDSDFWNEIGEIVDAEDPYERIVSIHPTPPGWDGGFASGAWSTRDVFEGKNWIDYHQIQVGHQRYRNELVPELVAKDYRRQPPMPVVLSETWYEFVRGMASAKDIRYAAWAALLSGAAGISYGGGQVWKAHTAESPEKEDRWPMEMDFNVDTLNYPGATGIGLLSRFFSELSWWRLTPHPELVRDYTPRLCLAAPGSEYLVYARWGGRIEIDLTDVPPNVAFYVEAFDPRNGEKRALPDAGSGGIRHIITPSLFPEPPEDWVIHLTRR